jgi:hypothetical protein
MPNAIKIAYVLGAFYALGLIGWCIACYIGQSTSVTEWRKSRRNNRIDKEIKEILDESGNYPEEG